MYYAGDGKVFLQADYKQAEAVVVAYLIGDKKLQNLFKASFGLSDSECKARNLDVHKITAASMAGFKVDFVDGESGLRVVFSQEVSGDMRRVGKTIRHAKNYSAGPGVLANKLGISMPAAKQLMTTYDLANPELQIWQRNDIQVQLKETRTLTNLFGRKHKFLDRWGDDLFRSSYSFIPQSTVGDLLNKALIILHDEFGQEVTIALQLHDAIYIIVDDNEAAIERGKWILKHCMIERVQPLVAKGQEFFIDIDYAVCRYWGELH
jgi:DNA polymerase-1